MLDADMQRIHRSPRSLEFEIDEGESIWTESSYKYSPDTVVSILARAGFRPVDQWIDDDTGFALTLVETQALPH